MASQYLETLRFAEFKIFILLLTCFSVIVNYFFLMLTAPTCGFYGEPKYFWVRDCLNKTLGWQTRISFTGWFNFWSGDSAIMILEPKLRFASGHKWHFLQLISYQHSHVYQTQNKLKVDQCIQALRISDHIETVMVLDCWARNSFE